MTSPHLIPEDPDTLRARLNLRAVLPCLAPLSAKDPHTAALLKKTRFSVRFSLQPSLSTDLYLNRGNISIDPPNHPKGLLKLRFNSARQLNKLFANQGLVLPFVSGSLQHLPKMLRFKQAADRLQSIILPRPLKSFTAETLRLHVDLLMGTLIPHGVVELAQHDPASQKALAPHSDWVVQIAIEQAPLSWLRSRRSQLDCGRGPAPDTPDALLTFRDYPSAALSIQSALDPLAAVGTGQIQVRGLIPVVDSLNLVMDRVGRVCK